MTERKKEQIWSWSSKIGHLEQVQLLQQMLFHKGGRTCFTCVGQTSGTACLLLSDKRWLLAVEQLEPQGTGVLWRECWALRNSHPLPATSL
jgi:hypothetical protein